VERHILQFGEKPQLECRDRVCAYAILLNEEGKLLTLKVGRLFHLPGGGVDDGEDIETALKREAMEEAGCEITDLKFLGTANEYFPGSKYGVVNKLGNFYKASIVSMNEELGIEDDHEVCWMSIGEFVQLENVPEFQKWAVRQNLSL
jgi:8-oxo-dGTP diphosphatase